MLERIFELFQKYDMNDSALCQALTLGNGTIGKWRQGKQKPSLEAVIKISQYFSVSIDYLVFGKTDSHVTSEENEWISLIQQLPDNAKAQFRGELIGYLKALSDMQQESKENGGTKVSNQK